MPVQPIHFVVALWGERFRRILVDLVLPNLLTAGNLGHFHGRPATFFIYTSENDAVWLSEEPMVHRLASVMPAEIVVVPGLGRIPAGDAVEPLHQIQYDYMTLCHNLAVARAEGEDAILVALPADALWSEGSFRHMDSLLRAGWDAVLIPGIRVVHETFPAPFKARFTDPASGLIVAPARQLVALAMAHLHPLMRALYHDCDHFIAYPSHVIFPAGDLGFHMRAFHSHPIAVRPQVKGARIRITIDHDYLFHAVPDWSRIHVVTDSDQMFQVAVDPERHLSHLVGHPRVLADEDIVSFARLHTNGFQRRSYVANVFCAHADDGASAPAWADSRAACRALGERLAPLLDF